jgi:tungstate transport system ATP-binding protein
MITEPELLLLDEPTANLDPLSTQKIEDLIKYYNRQYGTTIIMSSHDLYQGQRLANQVAVMMGGRFIQTGETIEVFSRPCSSDVARFIGITNILSGEIHEKKEGIAQINLSGTMVYALSQITSGKVTVAIRPEDITLYNEPDGKMSARNVLTGTITEIRPYGIISHVMVQVSSISLAVQITWQSVREMNLITGKNVLISFKAPSVHVMPYEENSTHCA